MNGVTLLYHDVVNPGEFSASGFPGIEADVYKLERPEFERHLQAIDATNSRFVLSFDDGGISFHDTIAPALEEHGWWGSFFIATNWIGKPGFLTADQIRELRDRGHQIGTHSCSHPPRISHCAFDEIVREWTDSLSRLSDILGEQVETGSVPGGYYSNKVAEAAAVSGIRTLYTSEPTSRSHEVNGCVVIGRFTIKRGMSAETAAALARADRFARLQQSATWGAKKALKIVGGAAWLKIRRRVLQYKAA
jgi:peptidoglycan/xylan/chitin deacetylase (PgdA/CDA1 family)